MQDHGNKMKKIIIYVSVITLIMLLAGCGRKAEERGVGNDMGNDGDIRIKDVTIQTSVRKTGQYPESICAVYSGSLDGISVGAADFKMTGKASIWGSNDKRPFEAGFSSVEVKGDTITLYPADYPEKFFYADEYKIACGKDERLNFTDKDVSKIVTPVADDFEYIEGQGGSPLNYHIFRPADEENKPLVIVFHGYGDTKNLLTYRTAVDWAEPENQKKRPCYVIAPTIDDMVYYRADKRDEILAVQNEVMELFIKKRTKWTLKHQYFDIATNRLDNTQVQLHEMIRNRQEYDLILVHKLIALHWRTAKLCKIRQELHMDIHSLQDGFLKYTEE